MSNNYYSWATWGHTHIPTQAQAPQRSTSAWSATPNPYQYTTPSQPITIPNPQNGQAWQNYHNPPVQTPSQPIPIPNYQNGGGWQRQNPPNYSVPGVAGWPNTMPGWPPGR